MGCMVTYHCRTVIIFPDRANAYSGGTVSKIASLVEW